MIVAKMETGWNREEGGRTPLRPPDARLTGALITAAGFMPIGFSKSTPAVRRGIFWIVGAAVVFSWICSGIFTPYLAVKLPTDFGKHQHGERTRRRSIAGCAS
jgi:multidrug efflux pump subunit AcrB